MFPAVKLRQKQKTLFTISRVLIGENQMLPLLLNNHGSFFNSIHFYFLVKTIENRQMNTKCFLCCLATMEAFLTLCRVARRPAQARFVPRPAGACKCPADEN